MTVGAAVVAMLLAGTANATAQAPGPVAVRLPGTVPLPPPAPPAGAAPVAATASVATTPQPSPTPRPSAAPAVDRGAAPPPVPPATPEPAAGSAAPTPPPAPAQRAEPTPAPKPTPPPKPAPQAPPTPPAPPPRPEPPEAAGAARPAGFETSAAHLQGWGEPNRVDDFDGGLGPDWDVYDSPGHVGNGRRTPDAVDVTDGIMTITGDPAGNTAGMAWNPGQKYGRWEGRVRAPASDETYNALMLLWPDAEDWPQGGEVDFMEMMDHTRQETHMFLHYGADNSQVSGSVKIDATQWHNWAVEWTPEYIAAFVDGREWWRSDDPKTLPPGPMHLCIQLDWFPNEGGGEVTESRMEVDWVRQYPLRDAEPPTTAPTTPPTTTPPTTTPPTTTPAPTTPPTTPPTTASAPTSTTPPTTPTTTPVPPTTTPVPTTTPLPVPPDGPGAGEDLTGLRDELRELLAEFRTLLVAYLLATGSGR